jgi:hypothetical protein
MACDAILDALTLEWPLQLICVIIWPQNLRQRNVIHDLGWFESLGTPPVKSMEDSAGLDH